MEYKFHPLAEAEFSDSVEWYAERSEEAKANFINEVLLTARRICKIPEAYPKIAGVKRSALLKKFLFSLIYVVEKNEIYILSVFHHSRHSKVWRNRG